MHKFYSNGILFILCAIVMYNLVTKSDIYEAIRTRRGKRRLKKLKNNVKKKVQKRVQKKNTPKEKSDSKQSSKTNSQISELFGKMQKLQLFSNKIPSKFAYMEKKINTTTDQLNELITKNTMKNIELDKYTKQQSLLLQGNIDMLSTDIIKNNMNYNANVLKTNNRLKSLNKDLNSYQKNNQEVEEVLKKINLELKNKFTS